MIWATISEREIVMITDHDFPEFITKTVNLLVDIASEGAGNLDLDTEGRFLSLFAGNDNKEGLNSYLKNATRSQIKENMQNDDEFMTLLSFINKTDRTTLSDFIIDTKGTMNAFKESEYATLIQALCFPAIGCRYGHSYWSYRLNSFDDYLSDYLCFTGIAEILIYEVFREEPTFFPQPVSRETPSFTDEDTAEDIVRYFQDNRIGYSYENIEKLKKDSLIGKTGTSHQEAEDWGFQKDKLLIALVSEYSLYNRKQLGLKEIVGKWVEDQGNTIEIDFFLSHLKFSKKEMEAQNPRISTYYRQSLINILKRLESRQWYSADDIWAYYKSSTAKIRGLAIPSFWDFCTMNIVGFCDGNIDDDFSSRNDMLIERPILFGYIYTLALFGCVEIIEKKPRLTVQKTKVRKSPYSAFDCLDAIRVTALGEWILGIRDSKPEIAKEFSEPVADKNLLLITYKGKDLDIKNFLSEIAQPIGEIRYKVTLSSFTSGCKTPRGIAERIEKFQSLIAPEPPGNWKEFFETVKESYVLTDIVSKGQLLKVENKEAFEKLMKEIPQLSSLVAMCQDDMIYLSEENQPKFVSLISKHGYQRPIRSRYEKQKETVL